VNFGAGKGHPGTIMMVSLGTGIGTALFSDGVLYPNSELGHVLMNGMDAEDYASNETRKRLELPWPDYTKRLNEYLLYMESLFWPDLFIIGGGGSKYHDIFIPELSTKAKVVPAHLLNEAGIIGAALNCKLAKEHA